MFKILLQNYHRITIHKFWRKPTTPTCRNAKLDLDHLVICRYVLHKTDFNKRNLWQAQDPCRSAFPACRPRAFWGRADEPASEKPDQRVSAFFRSTRDWRIRPGAMTLKRPSKNIFYVLISVFPSCPVTCTYVPVALRFFLSKTKL
jgi:hypothetical protein